MYLNCNAGLLKFMHTCGVKQTQRLLTEYTILVQLHLSLVLAFLLPIFSKGRQFTEVRNVIAFFFKGNSSYCVHFIYFNYTHSFTSS